MVVASLVGVTEQHKQRRIGWKLDLKLIMTGDISEIKLTMDTLRKAVPGGYYGNAIDYHLRKKLLALSQQISATAKTRQRKRSRTATRLARIFATKNTRVVYNS